MFTEFDDICHELLAKGAAIRMVSEPAIGKDVQGVMYRAVEVIYSLKEILVEIKDEGTDNSQFNWYASRADEALMLIKDMVK